MKYPSEKSSRNFQLYASYYNLLYKDKDYKSEVEYVELQFEKFSSSKILHILNLGCGTGNHDFLLAEKGYVVHGIDLSKGMVENAQKRVRDSGLKDSICFSQDDIRTVRVKQKFDAVISLFHVMSYQISNRDLEDVFFTAFEHLNTKGLFVFDCWYGPAVLADPPVLKIKEVEDDLISVHRIARPAIHSDKNIVDVNFEINVANKSNKNFEKFNELHRMRYLFDEELDLIAEKTGFSRLGAYKWLTSESPSKNSWNVVFIFRKE